MFRYRDLPGMIGRVGTVLGEPGINIVSAAVGRQPEDASGDDGRDDVTADSRCRRRSSTRSSPATASSRGAPSAFRNLARPPPG